MYRALILVVLIEIDVLCHPLSVIDSPTINHIDNLLQWHTNCRSKHPCPPFQHISSNPSVTDANRICPSSEGCHFSRKRPSASIVFYMMKSDICFYWKITLHRKKGRQLHACNENRSGSDDWRSHPIPQDIEAHLSQVYSPWKDQGCQGRKGMENPSVWVEPIVKRECELGPGHGMGYGEKNRIKTMPPVQEGWSSFIQTGSCAYTWNKGRYL